MLDSTLDLALASIGTSLAELRATATEIVVFGSRAADLAHANSDWDILCVGRGESRATPRVDLLWMSVEELRTERWTGSELAGHVSIWGKWIWGSRSWHADPVPSSSSVTLKGRRIVARARALVSAWDDLSEHHRHKHVTLLRRDLARYDLLKRGKSIPPTIRLDAALSAGCLSRLELDENANELGIRPLLARFMSASPCDARVA
jgi:hypothetical protein